SLTSLTSEEVVSTLKQMEELGLLVNDTQLTVLLRHGVVDASIQRLDQTLALEGTLFEVLSELAPDAEYGSWQDLNLAALTAGLKARLEHEDVIPLQVLRLLRSLSQDRESNSQPRSSFELKQVNHDYIKLKVQGKYSWSQIERFGEKRRTIASKLLQFLIGKLAPASKGKDLMVQSTFGELVGVIESDLELSQVIPPNQRQRAIEHVLLYLHKQEVLTLNHGMTVMRRAMTIEVNADKKGSYLKDDYLRLDEHYSEKRIQVHVMREYAEVALGAMASALELVLHYFTDSKDAFLQRYFSGREEVLKHATSEESWRSIVEDLSTQQRLIVVDDDDVNRLVLAGPGSGKTRVIVHRIAYLLRVRRVPANAIVALTFNRHAANEIRKRLLSLVGPDAYGVSVMTYHSMAMRLTGTRFERRDVVDEGALKQVLEDAVELLEGKGIADGEDDLREQLLRGYRYILVDEYQDIDALQYRLVSALAGRQSSEEGRLCILAVGDDDQNIYAWRDTNNRYIERFREDYSAATSYLVENYRSTQRIIAAANQLVGNNPGRLKASYPIRINRERQSDSLGGQWQALDPGRSGRVTRLAIDPSDRAVGNLQAQAAIEELKRLLALEEGGWSGCAILARIHQYLWPVQALCELAGVPYFLASDKDSALPITRQRDFVAVVDQLRDLNETLSAAKAWQHVSAGVGESWCSFFQEAFTQLQVELGECQLNSAAIVDWLYDYAREMRQQAKSGLYLGTVHSAKGLEFRHVVLLDGGWNVQTEGLNDERRLYYVGMTRAEQTLTLCEFSAANPFSGSLSADIVHQTFAGDYNSALERRYLQLSLKDIDIGFAGRSSVTNPIHEALRCLEPGAELKLEQQGERYLIRDGQGRVVGRTSQSFKRDLEVERCEVAGVVVRFLEDSEEQYRSLQKCERWAIVVPRICGVPLPAL
ncbi:UvrD-helicase domain-containing protein, partial [Pseudomonas aeruginosa]